MGAQCCGEINKPWDSVLIRATFNNSGDDVIFWFSAD